MKKPVRILAVVLALLIAMSSFCLSAFAQDAQEDPYAKFKEGIGYVAIGDSFTRGYGAGENWQNEISRNDTYGDYECRNVTASYPNLVANALGLNAPDDIRDTDAKFWPIAHDALSTAYILDLLGVEDNYRDEEFLYARSYMIKRYETDLAYFGDPMSYAVDGQGTYDKTGEIMSVREMIKNASLISLQVGQSDIVYKAQIFGLNELNLSDIKSLPSGIGKIVKLLFNYFDYWKSAYPLLLDFIKENNPDATVVLIGTMNPIEKATIADNFPLKIGGLINIIFDIMNAYTRFWACKYGYIFVDISDVDTPSSVTRTSIGHILSLTDETEFGLQAHPNTDGYAQIAEKVVKAIDNNLVKESLKTDFSFETLFLLIFDKFRTTFSKIIPDFS